MNLHSLVLCTLCLPHEARRSILIGGSLYEAKQQTSSLTKALEVSGDAREVFLPRSVSTGMFRRPDPQAGVSQATYGQGSHLRAPPGPEISSRSRAPIHMFDAPLPRLPKGFARHGQQGPWSHRVAPALLALDADLPQSALADGAAALDASGLPVSEPALDAVTEAVYAAAQTHGTTAVRHLTAAHRLLRDQRAKPVQMSVEDSDPKDHNFSTAGDDLKRAGEKTLRLGQRAVDKGRAATSTPARWLVAKTKEIVVVTGASSGLGLATTRALTNRGYFVVCAVRDPEKMEAVAAECGIKRESFIPLRLELSSLASVKDFVRDLRKFAGKDRPLNHLICNAAVYRPTDPKPAFTEDGYELTFGVNHLGHFLLVNLLLPDLERASNAKGDARLTIVGSITGNDNTIGGGFVYPKANIGELEGLKQGPGAEMVDGKAFDGAKAYKDAKSLNMMTMTELNRRFHNGTGITFNTMYPGCIAETNLFREKRQWFRSLFPLFMKYVTGGYISEAEAGERLAQLVYDPLCAKSGVYWGWNGKAQQIGALRPTRDDETGKTKWEVRGAGGSGGFIEEIELSGMNKDTRRARLVWEYSMDLVKDYLDGEPKLRMAETAKVD